MTEENIEYPQEHASTEYLEKFGYREYQGKIGDRKSRIWAIIKFEVTSTWHRSTFGKVILIVLMVLNFIQITIAATFGSLSVEGSEAQKDEAARDTLNSFIANYLNFGDSYIKAGTLGQSFEFRFPPITILTIALFAISGSGFFSDDRAGKVVEIYLSRLQKKEYIIGKIGAILIYINLFLMLPLLVTGALFVQSSDRISHFEAWDFYLGIIIYSLLASLIIGLAILSLSIMAEKRQYASLGFFLIYMIGSIFAIILIEQDPDNEFFLLLSPSYLFVLLAFICLQDFKLGIEESTRGFGGQTIPFLLDDGQGLEYFHVLGTVFVVIGLLIAFLSIKIKRMTTEEL